VINENNILLTIKDQCVEAFNFSEKEKFAIM